MKFKLGVRVRKIKGSSWQGIIVGTYSTTLTLYGYVIESEREKGSVQNYPEAALEPVQDGGTGERKCPDCTDTWDCPKHFREAFAPTKSAESHYVNSLTPEEQKKQDELQRNAVLTTTDTSDNKTWMEDFDELFLREMGKDDGYSDEREALKIFIQRQLERAREGTFAAGRAEGFFDGFEAGREEGKMGMYPLTKRDTQDIWETARAVERASLRERIVGMKKKGTGCGCYSYDRALSDLLDTLKDTH